MLQNIKTATKWIFAIAIGLVLFAGICIAGLFLLGYGSSIIAYGMVAMLDYPIIIPIILLVGFTTFMISVKTR